PVLVVPYRERVEVVERDKHGVEHSVRRTVQREWVFFPKVLDVGGAVEPDLRRSGLHKVRVYEWRGRALARFDVRIPADGDPARERSIGTPRLGYGIGDVRGLRGAPRLRIGGRDVPVLQGLDGEGGSGVHARLPVPRPGARLVLETRFDFR